MRLSPSSQRSNSGIEFREFRANSGDITPLSWQATACSRHGSIAALPHIVAAAYPYRVIWCGIPSECVFPLGVALGHGNTFVHLLRGSPAGIRAKDSAETTKAITTKNGIMSPEFTEFKVSDN